MDAAQANQSPPSAPSALNFLELAINPARDLARLVHSSTPPTKKSSSNDDNCPRTRNSPQDTYRLIYTSRRTKKLRQPTKPGKNPTLPPTDRHRQNEAHGRPDHQLPHLPQPAQGERARPPRYAKLKRADTSTCERTKQSPKKRTELISILIQDIGSPPLRTWVLLVYVLLCPPPPCSIPFGSVERPLHSP